jgi:hypothetical protein
VAGLKCHATFSINVEITLLITAVVAATSPISFLHPRTSI